MGLARTLFIALTVLLVAGGLLVFTDVTAFEAVGGMMLWVLGMILLLGIIAALALGVRALLFRRQAGRGGRMT